MNTHRSNEQWISTLREAIGNYKQKEFCRLADLGEAQLSRLLNPAISSAPRPSTLRKIAKVSKTVTYEKLMEAAGYLEETKMEAETPEETALFLASLLVSLKERPFEWVKKSPVPGALLSIELMDAEESWHFFPAGDPIPVLIGNLALLDIPGTDRCFLVTASDETFQALTAAHPKHLALPLAAIRIDVDALEIKEEVAISKPENK